jgi:hypothetical protein
MKGIAMNKIAYFLWLLSTMGTLAFAQEHPDFSGNWSLLKQTGSGYNGESAAIGQNDEAGYVITQTGGRFVVENKCAQCGNPVREYVTDGIVRNMPSKTGLVISYKAEWNQDRLVIDETVGGKTPFGNTMMVTRQKWTLSPDGQTMTLKFSSKSTSSELDWTAVYQRTLR